VTDLQSWHRLAGYAVGVAIGTVVGLAVNDRMNEGAAVVEVVVPGDGAMLRQAFQSRAWPATAVPVSGARGPATLLFLVVLARRADDVVCVARAVCPHALCVIRPTTAAHGVPGMATAVSI
jgi:uncharacterized protein YebE (UPF0316 family)